MKPQVQPPYSTHPSNFEGNGDQVYLVPSNFCTWLSFFTGHCSKLTVLHLTSLLNLRREEEYGWKCVKHGWSNNGRWERDGGGKDGDWYPPHVRSPPTFQPWLRLRMKQNGFNHLTALPTCVVNCTKTRSHKWTKHHSRAG